LSEEDTLDLGRSSAAAAAHDIRRFESAVWSLFTLSENASLPVHARAACRLAAEFATESLRPGDPRVAHLVALVIDLGGSDAPPKAEVVLARLKRAGVQATQEDMKRLPAPLTRPPSATIVGDAEREKALGRIFMAIESHLKDPDLSAVEKQNTTRRLEAIRASKEDVRTRTERAWSLLDFVERSLHLRSRETGDGA
jgi:hypothetical protein